MSFLNNSTAVISFLKESGGSKDATDNYSGTADKFYIAPPAGANYVIYSFKIKLEVAGALSSAGYGDGPVLSNGISLKIEDSVGTEVLDLLAGAPIKSNADWGRVVTFDPLIAQGAGNAMLTGTLLFKNEYGYPIKLLNKNSEGQRLVITVNDDFSVGGGTNIMVSHEFSVIGEKVKG